MLAIPSERVFIAGKSGTGKTFRAWQIYLSRYPRVIILDATGEWRGKANADVDTLEDCVEAITELAPNGKWLVRYSLADERFPELVNWLLPIPNLDAAPSQVVGGIALLDDEADVRHPPGPPGITSRNLYRRSRHAGLTVISATQRPGNCSKEVAAQSMHRIALFLDEPADVDYIADAMRWNQEQMARYFEWCRRHPHGAVWKEVQTGRLLWLR